MVILSCKQNKEVHQMSEQHIQGCMNRYAQRIERLLKEKYHQDNRFRVYYFPRYDQWVITCEETYGHLITLGEYYHISQHWRTRYLYKRNVLANPYIIMESALGELLEQLERIHVAK